jgi:hypothetical protein
MQKRLPWKLRPADFNQPDWHTRPTVAYELMFEYLRLSPSYELARKANQEGLTEEDKKKLPTDFEKVLKTYDLLGDVQKILFRFWWIERGLKVFGNPYKKPKVHLITDIKVGKELVAKDVQIDLDGYLEGTRIEEGLERTLLLALPVGLKKTEYKKQIEKILAELEEETEVEALSRIRLHGQRLRAPVLFKGLRLLWFKAAKPKWAAWRLGAHSRFSDSYSKELDVTSTRRLDRESTEIYDRLMMTKITTRALKKYEAIAENAARGKFPCEDQVEQADFNYPALAKRIKSKNTWEANTKKKLQAELS